MFIHFIIIHAIAQEDYCSNFFRLGTIVHLEANEVITF